MQQHPDLLTDRLLLTPPSQSDLEDITAQINSTEEIPRNIFNIPNPYTLADAENWLAICHEGWKSGSAFRFALRDKRSGRFIGMIGLHPVNEHRKAEVGYWLGKEFHGRGYAGEALMAVLRFGFETLDLNKIFATHFTQNPASGKVMEKAGMKHEGFLKQEYYHQNEFQDVHRYCILKSQWQPVCLKGKD